MPPPDRPEHLSIVATMILVAVGNFASAVLAALLVVLNLGCADFSASRYHICGVFIRNSA